jgi:hypothetical protein
MDRKDAIAWVLTVCASLRLSQAKTLSQLVVGAMRCSRISLAQIGRQLLGETSAKHKIKRTWRFIANPRIEVSDAMRGVVARLVKRHRKKPLLVAFDWTDIRGFCTLMAAAVIKGRAVPLLWATYPKWELHKSQNNLEEGLLYLLRSMVPESVKVILLADRGFGRTELARLCQDYLHFHYVIRIRPDVYIRHPEHEGKLLDLPVRRGVCRFLGNVNYRKEDPVRQHVVVRWKHGLAKDRDECWFLMTDLERCPRSLSDLYGKRMTVEELFRDDKNKRNGWSLRDTLVTRADRIDRLLLILALAYLLLVGIGLVARQSYREGTWSSSNKPRQCSDFLVGLIMLERLNISPTQALAAVTSALTKAAGGKWG